MPYPANPTGWVAQIKTRAGLIEALHSPEGEPLNRTPYTAWIEGQPLHAEPEHLDYEPAEGGDATRIVRTPMIGVGGDRQVSFRLPYDPRSEASIADTIDRVIEVAKYADQLTDVQMADEEVRDAKRALEVCERSRAAAVKRALDAGVSHQAVGDVCGRARSFAYQQLKLLRTRFGAGRASEFDKPEGDA